MKQDSGYILFNRQLDIACNNYKNLKINEDDKGFLFLKGILDIPNDEKEIVGNFLVEIHFREGFPYRFPLLFETGGDIPQGADWHKNYDGSCCITVRADEIVKCRNGITLPYFIEKYAIGYFANQIFKKHEGRYKNGEFKHNKEGIFQFYEELLKTTDEYSGETEPPIPEQTEPPLNGQILTQK